MNPATGLILESPLAKSLTAVFGDKILAQTAYRGDLTILIQCENWPDIARTLKNHEELKFEQMMDLTAVDYLKQERIPRFQMVYHFLSLTHQHRLRVKIDLGETNCEVATISHLWAAADWYERECFDMMGVHFLGHPHLKRILMYEEFVGHPLRKDYPIWKEQPLVPLKEVPERYDYMGYKEPKY